MSSTVDSVGALLTQIQSGLVVSGNNSVTVTRAFSSGDAFTSMKMSGTGIYQMIALRLARSEVTPLVGGPNGFQSVADYVRADAYTHYPMGTVSNTSSAVTAVEQLVRDFKVTVKSGVWSSGNPAMPYLVNEVQPSATVYGAHAELQFRFRYLQ